MHRPLFSNPSHSIADRIAAIKPKINPAFLDGKTEFEKLMLEQNDIGFQQNETLAVAADEIREKLIQVHEQTSITNGKVKDHESRIAQNEKVLEGYQKASAKRTKILVTSIPILGIILEIIAKKLGFL